MQDRQPPPSPPEVRDLDSENEMILEGEIEEIIDLDDSIFESASSSENESESLPMEEHAQIDDAVCIFRGHTPSEKSTLISTMKPINTRDINSSFEFDLRVHSVLLLIK